jgi:hypothetical protein
MLRDAMLTCARILARPSTGEIVGRSLTFFGLFPQGVKRGMVGGTPITFAPRGRCGLAP